MKELYLKVQQWVDACSRIEDLGIRKHQLLDRLQELAPDAFAEALYYILRQAQMGRPAFKEVMDAVSDLEPMIARLGRPFFSEVYTYARAKHFDDVVHFLRQPRPKRGLKTAALPDPDQLANELTLGQRRALAMSPDRHTMEQLMFDPDPSVIHRLLSNPRITLPFVIRIAARRPNYPAVLTEVFHSPRWIVHYDIKVALVRNPYTPPPICLRLLPNLRTQDLREAASDTSLLPEIQEAARDLLQKRVRQTESAP